MSRGRAAATSSSELVEDLFRREYAHLVSALTRALGPSNVPLVEDVVQDALLSAMHAWRFGLPRDPKAWIIRAAHNRAIDVLRRERRQRSLLPELATTAALADTIEAALASSADGANQLAMMFAVCDPGLTRETQVTLICGSCAASPPGRSGRPSWWEPRRSTGGCTAAAPGSAGSACSPTWTA